FTPSRMATISSRNVPLNSACWAAAGNKTATAQASARTARIFLMQTPSDNVVSKPYNRRRTNQRNTSKTRPRITRSSKAATKSMNETTDEHRRTQMDTDPIRVRRCSSWLHFVAVFADENPWQFAKDFWRNTTKQGQLRETSSNSWQGF